MKSLNRRTLFKTLFGLPILALVPGAMQRPKVKPNVFIGDPPPCPVCEPLNRTVIYYTITMWSQTENGLVATHHSIPGVGQYFTGLDDPKWIYKGV